MVEFPTLLRGAPNSRTLHTAQGPPRCLHCSHAKARGQRRERTRGKSLATAAGQQLMSWLFMAQQLVPQLLIARLPMAQLPMAKLLVTQLCQHLVVPCPLVRLESCH